MITENTYNAKVRRRRWRPRALWPASFVALLILIPLAAACSGGSSSPGVANVDSTPTPADGSSSNDSTEPSPGDGDALAYSQCMRENGISNFPDPDSDGGLALDANALGIEPDSPQFKAADEACKKYLPNCGEPPAPDPEARAAALEYSQCMRDQGISNFPDPNPNGTIDVDTNKLGLGPDSPQFEAAHEACKHYLPGGGEGGGTDQSGGGE